MIKNIIFACLIGLTTQSLYAQSYAKPYRHHYTHGHFGYGWGYTPIINGVWYWNYYGLNFPSWTNYGYPYQYNQPVKYYASISYSPSTGKYGSSWGETNLRNAVNSANAYCIENDCRSTVWVADGCAAVSKNQETGSIGWAYADNKNSAIINANKSCSNSLDQNCTNLAWACSGY